MHGLRVVIRNQPGRPSYGAALGGAARDEPVRRAGRDAGRRRALWAGKTKLVRLVVGSLAPTDIDAVAAGLPTRVRLTTFSHLTTPPLDGRVIRVSASLCPRASSSFLACPPRS